MVKKRFRLADYQGDYVMNCRTEEEAKVFCKFLDDNGRKWCSGKKYTEYVGWKEYQWETCYHFNEGTRSYIGLMYSTRNKILNFSDFDWKKRTFEVGKKYRYVGGGSTHLNHAGRMDFIKDGGDIEYLDFIENENGQLKSLVKQLKEQLRWRPVSEKPERCGEYLCTWDFSDSAVMYYDDSGWSVWDASWDDYIDTANPPKYWLPIPPAPEGE